MTRWTSPRDLSLGVMEYPALNNSVIKSEIREAVRTVVRYNHQNIKFEHIGSGRKGNFETDILDAI